MNERIDRRIEEVKAEAFKIKEQNAHFREMVRNLERRVDLVEYTQDKDEDRLVSVEEVGPTLIRMLHRQEERLDLQRLEYKVERRELEEKMKEMAEAIKETTKANKETAEANKETTERLNAFIVVLESYIQENRQRRNGNGNGDH